MGTDGKKPTAPKGSLSLSSSSSRRLSEEEDENDDKIPAE
jgi:hypothetical protein